MALGFIKNIKNGFIAANEVRKVVLSDKQLFVYPILAVVFGVLAIAILGGFSLLVLAESQSVVPLLILLFMMYMAVVFIAVYFLVAMLIAFREFANKNKITVGDAIGRTNQYIVPILEWVVFISVIKILLDIVEVAISAAFSKYGALGNIMANLITGVASLALAVASLFAVPIIIDDKTGPFETIKTSTKFIIKNWGETLGGFAYTEIFQVVLCGIGGLLFFLTALSLVSAGNIGAMAASVGLGTFLLYGFLGLVLIFALSMSTFGSLIVFLVILAMDLQAPSHGVAILVAGVALLFVMIGHLLNYMMFNCFKLVVYDYKSGNKLPADFDKSVIDNSVQRKAPQGQNQGGGSPFGMLGGLQQ